MFRPSRPMMRPFMSSDGSSTSETVVSAAWLAATRCRASPTRFRARRFASVRASSSSWRTMRARSRRTSSSERSSTTFFASSTVSPEMRSSSRSWSSLAAFVSSCNCLRWPSRSRRPCSRRSSSVSLRSISSSFVITRSSILAISERFSLSSCSTSARSLSACSRASTCASRRIDSAARTASVVARSRSASAAAARRERSTRVPTSPPTTSPTTIPRIRRPIEVAIARSYVGPVGTAVSVNRRPAGTPRGGLALRRRSPSHPGAASRFVLCDQSRQAVVPIRRKAVPMQAIHA